jgi:FkbM family methyltransferase
MRNLLKRIIKKSDSLVSFYSKVWWKIFYFKNWWGAKVWRKTKVAVTPFGFKLASGYHPAYKLMQTGKYEMEEAALVDKLLDGVDVFVDVGANIGYFTCIALQKGKRVISVEPQRQNLTCLYQNLILNSWQDNSEVFPVALSEKPGLLPLYGASGPAASLIQNWSGYSSRFKQIVPVSTLDNIIGCRYQDKELLIKVDVEGVEYKVLKGASDTLKRNSSCIWMMEILLQKYHPEGLNPAYQKIFKLFWENGYKAYTATETPKLVTAQDVEGWLGDRMSGSGTANYIFAAEEKMSLSDQ